MYKTCYLVINIMGCGYSFMFNIFGWNISNKEYYYTNKMIIGYMLETRKKTIDYSILYVNYILSNYSRQLTCATSGGECKFSFYRRMHCNWFLSNSKGFVQKIWFRFPMRCKCLNLKCLQKCNKILTLPNINKLGLSWGSTAGWDS